MLITIRVTSGVKDKIDRLVNKGLYPDFNTAALIALENLATLEEEHESEGGITAVAIPATPANSSSPTPVSLIAPPSLHPSVPCFFWRGAAGDALKLIRDFPSDRFSPGDKVYVERWLFGQQNRILPLKVNARLLLALLADFDGIPFLPIIADEMSKQAVPVAEALTRMDQEQRHNKDDAFATAFPATLSDKSRQRFADQFIGTENGQGELSGMLIDWKLATIDRKKGKTLLYPTQACLAFADLPNPLLDNEDPSKSTGKFSEDELKWALNHVATHVHVESYTFTTLLRAIIGGANDPTSLDRNLRETGIVEHKKTSDEFVGTQRAGALSRMADLDIVRRIRAGVRISYEVTPRGQQWLTTFD